MKLKLVCLLVGFFLLNSIQAQYGLRAKYNINDYATATSDLGSEFNVEEVLSSSFEIGIDYWFRLKTKRIEFYPEVLYSFGSTSTNAGIFTSIDQSKIGFNLNTHFYLLDFVEDCNCPTFSKQGPSISKGFFIHFSPGVSYETYSMNTTSGQANKAQQFSGKIGGGVGLDIGLSDLVTITPIYTYNVNFGGDWDISTFPGGIDLARSTSTINNQHQFSLRMGVRLDYR